MDGLVMLSAPGWVVDCRIPISRYGVNRDIGMLPEMPKITPKHTSPTMKAILAEAKSQGATAYGLQKSTGLALSTVQHLLSGKGTPSIYTAEALADALGLVVKVERKA